MRKIILAAVIAVPLVSATPAQAATDLGIVKTARSGNCYAEMAARTDGAGHYEIKGYYSGSSGPLCFGWTQYSYNNGSTWSGRQGYLAYRTVASTAWYDDTEKITRVCVNPEFQGTVCSTGW